MPVCPVCKKYSPICPICWQEADFEVVGRTTSVEKTPTIIRRTGQPTIAPKQRTIMQLKCLKCGGVMSDIYIQGELVKTEISKPKEVDKNGDSKGGENQVSSGEDKLEREGLDKR